MPEIPDITLYLEALEPRVVGEELTRIRVFNPFLLRTAAPPISEVEGARVRGLRRIGKRIVFEFEGDLFLVLHLMIAGRLRWRDQEPKPGGKMNMAALVFPRGTLLLTEASTKKRSSLHLVAGEAALAEFDRGGLEPLGSSVAAFGAALTRENHTLKRALTDPGLFSGIGNAYSDEILHRARLSPLRLTAQLTGDEIGRLHAATEETLRLWIARLREETGGKFPEKVTAFREGMAVHGRHKEPCPVCGTPVQRIVYAENECNYCPTCQTEGRLLADRALSQLLKKDWPKTLQEMEERKAAGRREPE